MSSPAEDQLAIAEHAARSWQIAQTALAADSYESIPAAAVQQLMTAAIKLYVAKRELDQDFPPFLDDEVSATEVAVLTHQALKAVDMQLFEMTLWQGLGKD